MPSFHATVNTAKAQDRILLMIAAVPNELARATQTVADDAALIYQGFAPRGLSGRLGRGIRVVSAQGRVAASGQFATGRQFAVIASARNAEGFDYVGVTRFGHRKKFIRPSASRGAASVISTGRARRRYGEGAKHEQPALRIEARNGGKPIYRHKVRGVVVAHDWAASAAAAVNREVEDQAQKLAHRLERTFG